MPRFPAQFTDENLPDGSAIKSRTVGESEPEPAWAAKILDEDRIGYAEEQRREREAEIAASAQRRKRA